MAEIVPPTTILRPTGTPLVRFAVELSMRTFAFADTGGKPFVAIDFDRVVSGGKRETPPLPRSVP